MTRPAIQCALPALPRPVAGAPRDTAAALATLRRLAQEHRGAAAQPFYPMRTTAAAFGLHLASVAGLYHRLEQEGLIMRVRGSATLLLPRRRQPRFPVRGVVAMPLWEYGFCHLSDWRIFFRALDNELRHRGFVIDPIFSRIDEAPTAPEFAERLLAHHPDVLLWFKPISAYRSTLQTLRDAGIPGAALMEGPAQAPGSHLYRLGIDDAVRASTRAWRRQKIKRAVVCAASIAEAKAWPIVHALAHNRFPTEFASLSDRMHLPALAANLDAHTVAIIPDHPLTHGLCETARDAFERVLRQHRVLVCNHLELPSCPSDMRVDLIAFDWARIASQVAEDIAAGRLMHERPPTLIPASFHPLAPPSRFAVVM